MIEAFAKLQTSAKIIFILSLALAPLGIIALLASIQSLKVADNQRRAELRVAATEASRKLAVELSSDITALREALYIVRQAPADAAACTRAQTVLQRRQSADLQYALFSASAVPPCTNTTTTPVRPVVSLLAPDLSIKRVGNDLEVILYLPDQASVAVARYDARVLGTFARPDGYGAPYRLTVDIDGAPIVVIDRIDPSVLARTESVSMPVGLGTLALTITVGNPPFGALEALITFLPLLMWASAAAIGFYVVDRLLIKPLKKLRIAVGTYEPGSSRRILADTPTVEIRELEAGFTAYADRLAEREHEVEAALAKQMRLTREVHHRVKNNLQVISSLISLRSRDVTSPDAGSAYAAIQRRVDALAIVHRNHYAELEANIGIEAKALLSELVANFRVNAKATEGDVHISLAVSPVSLHQDVATPLAFLFTELAEMAFLSNRALPITVSLIQTAVPAFARFEVASLALPTSTPGQASFRIIEGLARQLRATLDHDVDRGAYSLEVAVLTAA